MGTITGFSEYDENIEVSKSNIGNVALKDLSLEQQEFIERVQSAFQSANIGDISPSGTLNPNSIKHLNSGSNPQIDALIDDMENFLEEFDGEEGPISEGGSTNFMIRVRELVGRMLEVLGDIAEKDRGQLDKMKESYRKISQNSAGVQRSFGNITLYTALIGFAFQLGQFGFDGNTDAGKSDRMIMEFLASHVVPKGGEMAGAYKQAAKGLLDAEGGLIMTEINNKINQKSSEGNSKQEALQMMQAALEAWRSASRSQ